MGSNVKESKVTEKRFKFLLSSLALIPKLETGTSGNHDYLFKITILRSTVKDINELLTNFIFNS